MSEQENIRSLRLPDWGNACYIVEPDRKQLEESIKTYGILSPVVIQADGTIIDGVHRVEIASGLGMRSVPVVRLDIDKVEAMILHIDLNRYRGIVVAKYMSRIIKRILGSGKYDYDKLRKRLKMTKEEFDVLADGTLIKMRKIKQHTYSPAWVPIESNKSEDMQIERPTGHKEQV